jgi:histidine triad (HIT) family protein
MDECVFCDIIAGRLRARIVAETSTTLAFFPTQPAVVGHILLVPKQHVADLWSLDDVTGSQLAEQILPIARAIRSAIHPDGLNVINSTGKAATQTVRHIHVHLVPRWFNDSFGPLWPEKHDSANEDLEIALHEIRRAIGTA